MTKSALSLDSIREQLNQLDEQLLSMLSQRRQLSLEVAKNKVAFSKAIRDPKREQALLVELIIKGREKYQLDACYITKIFHAIIEDSVLSQQHYVQALLNQDHQLTKAKVAYLGRKGSYSNLASLAYFRRKNIQLTEHPCQHFKEIIEAVESDTADFGVLPIENTSSGSINEVYDLLQKTSLHVVGEIIQPIEHCLLATTDTTLDDIETIYSHPQSHQQCREFLSQFKKVELLSTVSTADAIAKVQHLASKKVAAIGNRATGDAFGLKTLKSQIADQNDNQTRFIFVAKQAVFVSEQVPAKTSLIMSTGQQSGALVDALLVFKRHNINMTKLESRPVLGNPWEEIFYVDLEANLHSQQMEQVLEELNPLTKHLKILGCYPIEQIKPTTIHLDGTAF